MGQLRRGGSRRVGESIQVKVNGGRRMRAGRGESRALPRPQEPPCRCCQSHRGLGLQPHDKLVRLGIHKLLGELEEGDLLGAHHQAEVLAF